MPAMECSTPSDLNVNIFVGRNNENVIWDQLSYMIFIGDEGRGGEETRAGE